jgi:hypothetical protein
MSKHSLFAASVLALAISAAFAQPASGPVQSPGSVEVTGLKPAPVEDYVKPPAFSRPTLSPDGRYLAVSVPLRGKMNLAIVDLETRKGTAITNVADFDILARTGSATTASCSISGRSTRRPGPSNSTAAGCSWCPATARSSRSCADGARATRVERQCHPADGVPADDSGKLERDPGHRQSAQPGLGGRLPSRPAQRPDHARHRRPAGIRGSWILDSKGTPRVVVAGIKDTLTTVVSYRSTADSPWKEIARNERGSGSAFIPLGFLSDDKTLMVAANPGGRDTMAIFKFDPETRQLGEVMAQHPRFDVGADVDGNPAGSIVHRARDRPRPRLRRQRREAADGVDRREGRSNPGDDRSGVAGHAQRLPAVPEFIAGADHLVFRREPGTLLPARRTEEDARGALHEQAVARKGPPRRNAALPAEDARRPRDSVYYFLPRNYKPGDKLPTVVHVHGGPHVRADTWARGFGYMEAEILASHGYA